MPFKISIVIPAYNEELLLPRALRAIKKQDLKEPYEIIVIDNASTDKTAEVASNYAVKIVHEAKKGYAYALRRGFREAHGEIVAVTDADSIVPRNWLSQILKHFEKNPTSLALGGTLELCDCSHFLSKTSKIATLFNWHTLSGANMAIRKSAFAAINGYNLTVHLGAELFLVKNLKKLGSVSFDPRLCVKTSGRRFQNDFSKTILTYLINDFWLAFFNKPKYENFTDIRNLQYLTSQERLLARLRLRSQRLLEKQLTEFKTQIQNIKI